MRVLLLNQYYWPDPAATAQLLTDFAEHLASEDGAAALGQRCCVDVVCTRRGYDGKDGLLPAYSVHNGVHIHRVDAPMARCPGAASAPGRVADMLSFQALALARCLSLPRADVCVAMTSPPFVASLGVMLRRLRSTRLVLWLMDLYPDVASALGFLRPNSLGHRAMDRLARGIYRRADRIVTPGAAMHDRLRNAGVPDDKLLTIPNWSPNERLPSAPRSADDSALHVMYSGHLGLAHEFDTVVEAATMLRRRRDLRITFAGRGPRLAELIAETRRRGLDNVRFTSPQSLETLPEFLASADVHLVTMRERAEGLVVPSKLYGILAAGRPALFVGPNENEVAHTLADAGAGWTVRPGRAAELAGHFERLATDRRLARRMGHRARRYYDAHCTRLKRCRALARLIHRTAVSTTHAAP